MTADQALSIAERRALDLNLPWSRDQVTVQRRRIWPFPGNWRVVARVPQQGAIVTMLVSARTGYAQPKRIYYPAGGLA